MALIYGSVTGCAFSPGLVHRKLHLHIQNHNRSWPINYRFTQSVAYKIHRPKIHYDAVMRRNKYIVCAERNQHHFYHNDVVNESFWSESTQAVLRGLKSFFSFLLEQPSQLQYVEWPSFQSTLKTATLTLILVALLIVALASVDSALAFILATLLRRPA